MDQPADQQAQLTEQLIQMVRMIVAGTQTLAAQSLQDAKVAVR